MKNLEYYLNLNYTKTVYQDEEGDFIIEVPDLPGCVADGATPAEAFENVREAMASWIESRVKAGLAIPEPKKPEEYSGKILVRMPQFLHRRLAEQAKTEGVSLNQYVVACLTDASAAYSARSSLDQAAALFSGGAANSALYGVVQSAVTRITSRIRYEPETVTLALGVGETFSTDSIHYCGVKWGTLAEPLGLGQSGTTRQQTEWQLKGLPAVIHDPRLHDKLA